MEKILPDDVLTLIYRHLRPDEPTPAALVMKRFMEKEELTVDDFYEELHDVVFLALAKQTEARRSSWSIYQDLCEQEWGYAWLEAYYNASAGLD